MRIPRTWWLFALLLFLAPMPGLFTTFVLKPGSTAGVPEPVPAQSGNLYGPRTVWTPVHSTSPNVSHYVYRDMNGNGVFDEGDRPMMGIAVRMTRPDGTTVVRRSNLNGFVNFTNSLTASPVDVDGPGEYRFEVLVPEGWVLTSDNAVQTAVYSELPNSRPGIVADQVPVPAGLAPVLRISGRVAELVAGELMPARNTVVRAVSDSATFEVPPRVDGRFSIPVTEGHWSIEVRDAGNRRLLAVRTLDVGLAPVRMSTIVLGATEIPRAPVRSTIDFEAVTASTITKMPNGVAGLAWTNLIPVENTVYRGEGYINNTVSGKYIAYNTSGYPVSIVHPDGFDFIGGYFGVAWLTEAEGETLEVRAWRGDALVGGEELELSALGPVWFDADYRGITRLELATRHYWQFVTDDLVIGVR